MLAEAGNAFEFSRLGHARSGCALGDHAPGSRVFTYAEKPESVLANHRRKMEQRRDRVGSDEDRRAFDQDQPAEGFHCPGGAALTLWP